MKKYDIYVGIRYPWLDTIIKSTKIDNEYVVIDSLKKRSWVQTISKKAIEDFFIKLSYNKIVSLLYE